MKWTTTPLTERLCITYPLVQAGMAGGSTTPALVAAVSNAGGLGTLGAGYMTAEQIRTAIRAIRELTDRPFAVNLFVEEEVTADPEQISRMQERMRPLRDELGIEAAAVHTYGESFAEQVQVLIEERVPVFSFTFGIPSAHWMQQLKAAGILLIGTATTVREGIELEQRGVDMIVAQGSEAGGHRGTFIGSHEQALIGTIALVPQLVDHVQVPVIAAGGIMDGRGVVAALALGAAGAQLGTAFLTAEESGAHPAHQEAILASTEESTVLTNMFSGRHARGIENEFIREMAPHSADVPPYPVQNALTRDIRQAAAKQHRAGYLSLWAGQGTRLNARKGVAELIAGIAAEAHAVLQKW